jgi:hypothetical protein
MDWACSTHKGGESTNKCSSENLKERDHAEDLGVGESIILEWILEK